MATYRRGGPRLKVKVQFAPYGLLPKEGATDPSRMRVSWHVHVANTGAAAIEVEKVEVTPWIPPRLVRLALFPGKILLRKFVSRPGGARALRTGVVWLDGADKMRIEPYGGARWVVNDSLLPDSRDSLDVWSPEAFGMIRLRVTLTNGREVTSRAVRLHRVLQRHEYVRSNLTLLEKQMRDRLPVHPSPPTGSSRAEPKTQERP
ncbi:hypothetical protein Saso_32690 [Streptomyces asoensis]|uniref:DUF11 domain-containing protein n=2 Tax=Streptomyces asoensis TaxID=249586 RepID=A0ABQ3S0I4_9ACTN|nr:hypothetical protein GCM10010496_26020 [Streptomyces asoensis]GHI61619.1 hypothetical protein Saso_32690 [Streptomyces asoensis]